MALPLLILLLVIISVVLFFVRQNNELKKYDHLPQAPKGWPLLGNMLEVLAAETGAAHLKWAMKLGGLYSYTWLLTKRVVVADPEYVKHVLVTNSENYTKNLFQYEAMEPILGKGLVTTADIDFHRSQRALCNQAFTHASLKSLVPLFQNQANVLISKWRKIADSGAPIDLYSDLTKLTVDVIGHAAFGTAFKTQTTERDDEANVDNLFFTFRDIFATFGLQSILGVFPYVRRVTPSHIRREKLAKKLNAQTHLLIKNKKSARDSTGSDETADLLDILIDAKDEHNRGLSDQELADQAKTFLLAGHETSSSALMWTLYLLAKHSDVEEKLVKEVRSILGRDRLPTHEDIENMKYLKATLKESLRVYPPVPLVFRKCEKDDQIGPHFIPGGSVVAIIPYIMHHMKEPWGDPENFRPERWMEGADDSTKLNKSWMPFIAGPRNCIGSKFALLEMKVILAMLVQNFSVKLSDPSIKVIRSTVVTMRAKPNILVNIENRPVT